MIIDSSPKLATIPIDAHWSKVNIVCLLSYTGHVVTRVFAREFEASAAMSKRPFSTLLDYGFQCTSKHSRVTSPSAEVNDQPELDPDDNHSQSTVGMSSYPGPAGYACHTVWLATRLSMEHYFM